VVVEAGETLTATPLVTAIFPGVITPVPEEKLAVSCAEPPAAMLAGLAVKLWMEGVMLPCAR
jgi:hypothetical protein